MHSGHDSGVFSAWDPALLREADYRAPGAILAPRLGMEGTMIKVDKYLARFWKEAIVLLYLLVCMQ